MLNGSTCDNLQNKTGCLIQVADVNAKLFTRHVAVTGEDQESVRNAIFEIRVAIAEPNKVHNADIEVVPFHIRQTF